MANLSREAHLWAQSGATSNDELAFGAFASSPYGREDGAVAARSGVFLSDARFPLKTWSVPGRSPTFGRSG